MTRLPSAMTPIYPRRLELNLPSVDSCPDMASGARPSALRLRDQPNHVTAQSLDRGLDHLERTRALSLVDLGLPTAWLARVSMVEARHMMNQSSSTDENVQVHDAGGCFHNLSF